MATGQQGYAATTIQQIAEQADVAWQTVYSVFGTKAAVLSAVFDVAVAGDDEEDESATAAVPAAFGWQGRLRAGTRRHG